MSHHTLVSALLEIHGSTYADELGIDLSQNTPSALFRWLCATLLMSARIPAGNAMRAASALADAGWTTARTMAGSSWRQRVDVLNRNGYARFDESTARMLGEDVEMLLDHYGGDLRKLRERADRDTAEERKLLKEFKGIGDVGADIFFREAQTAWDELHPFADRKALEAAETLGLPKTAEGLSKLVPKADFSRLVAALVRTELGKDHDAIRDRAKRQ